MYSKLTSERNADVALPGFAYACKAVRCGRRKRMTFHVGLFISGLVCLSIFIFPGPARSYGVTDYRVKAGIIYRFLLFTQWPPAAFAASPDSIVIGIVGENPFENLFEQITDRRVHGRKLVIHYLTSNPSPDELRSCQVLFFNRNLGGRMENLLDAVSKYPVLTISDADEFIDMGGMIMFRIVDRHVRFIINRTRAMKVGISFSSQMLQLAINVF